jgi:hypothetical protein
MIALLIRSTCLVSCFTLLAAAQEPEDAPSVTSVIALKHLQAKQAEDILGNLGLMTDYVFSDERNNRLILRGHGQDIAEAARLIAELDRPAESSEQQPSTALMAVHSYPVEELASIVIDTFHRSGSRAAVAADTVSGRLVVRGSSKDVQEIRDIVAKMDQPRTTYTLEMFFLQGTIGGAAAPDGAAPLPESLRPVATTLQQNGFASLSLLAPITVHVDGGREFQHSSRQERSAGTAREELTFRVSGSLRSPGGEGAMSLELATYVVGRVIPSEPGLSEPASLQYFAVETDVSLVPGRYVLLAAAPSTTSQGSAMALVIRATAAK